MRVRLLHPLRAAAAPTYTTTVSGKITTPAGNPITTAKVWTKSSNKVSVDSTNGSYSLKVTHSGSFTLTAEDPNGNYKTSAPKTVKTTKPKEEKQDIALKYGYTTTLTGQVFRLGAGSAAPPLNGVNITIKVEGREAARDTSDNSGNYSLTFAHPGSSDLRGRLAGYRDHDFDIRTKKANETYSFVLFR